MERQGARMENGDEMPLTYCQSNAANVNARVEYADVQIKLMAERVYPACVLIRDLYFEGGDVLRCYRGRFRFTLEGHSPVVVGENETIVVFPGQCVTIEALDAANALAYVRFEGRNVASYFERLGFFNGIHGPTSPQIEVFRDVKRDFESKRSPDHAKLMMGLSEALVTYGHDLRVGANAVVGDAIRQIRENLTNGIVRLTPLYEQLHIGHTALSHAFRQAGFSSPAQVIRQEQLRVVKRLLKTTQRKIADIAKEAGFISITHFANFIKRTTGMTARELRRGHWPTKTNAEKE